MFTKKNYFSGFAVTTHFGNATTPSYNELEQVCMTVESLVLISTIALHKDFMKFIF